MRVFLLSALLAACASESSLECLEAADAGAPGAELRSAECSAQDQALQAVLDANRKSPNALLAVRNEQCGTTLYLSGNACHATATSLWRIGSVTKTYVATTLMILASEGRVGLDDDLRRWLPSYSDIGAITLRQLLGHRSGVFNYTEDPAFQVLVGRDVTPDQIVRFALLHSPYFAPGTDFHYSNTGYILLGMVIESVTGQPLNEVIRTRVLAPAGLEHTFFDGAEPISEPVTHGRVGKTFFNSLGDPSWPWGAGAMLASGGDLVDWIWTLYGTDRLLNTQQRTMAIVAGELPGSDGYGLGVITLHNPADSSKIALGHTGAIDGFLTSAFYYPALRTAIAVVVNGGQQPPDVIRSAARAVLPPGSR